MPTQHIQKASPRRPTSSHIGALVLTATCALAVGCDRELATVVELADFAGYQADQVTTHRIAPGTDSARLATHGWRIDTGGEGDAPALIMRRDRARLWFYSADGSATGLELRGGLSRSTREGRRVLCRLNGVRQQILTLRPLEEDHALDFTPETVRQGWNYVQLSLRRLAGGEDESVVRLRGVRVLTSDDSEAPSRGGRIAVREGDLEMPVGSLLDATFSVAPGARFQSRVQADSAGQIRISLQLLAEDGSETEVAQTELEPGGVDRLDVDLEAWAGTTVRLRTLVSGSPRSGAIWSEARVAAPNATRVQPTDGLILPKPLVASGALEGANVVLILLDAARADAFSPWGGPYPTPAIEKLVTEGTKFSSALSPTSWTGQSVPAMLTGFFPETVGVRHWSDRLTTKVPTLAELFEGAGYHTVLWSQHPLYSRGLDLSRSFARADYVGHDQRDSLPEVDDLFVDGKPSFALVHLMAPHTPYEPPPPFRGRRSSWYAGNPLELPVLEGAHRKKPPEELTDDDKRYLRDRYLENVEYADALVGRVLERLEASGRYDQTLVAVISDHGEAFLEHDEFLHNSRVYWEFLHVPFAVKWPAALTNFPSVVDARVSLVDLAPTLASAFALPGADKGFQGVDLFPAILGEAAPERPLYAMTRGVGDPRRASRRWIRWERDGWAAIWDQLGDRVELYDLRADPGEQNNLATERPTHAALLLQTLRLQYHFNQALLALGAGDAAELAPELAKDLEALGYL